MTGLFSYPKRKLRKLAKNGDYKEAIEFGNSIAEKFSNDGDYHFIMGSIYYILEDASSALRYFDKTLELNEYDTETLLLKANIHAHIDESETAIKCLQKILEVDSENQDAINLLKKLKN